MGVVSFAITGCGRSGTKFLASMMGRSKKVEVRHEPRGGDPVLPTTPTEEMLADFDKNNYGEVNSYLRYCITELPVAQMGVILRRTDELFLSGVNWKGSVEKAVADLPELMRAQKQACALARRKDVLPISFHGMTRDVNYLNTIIRYFGISDVTASEVDLQDRINRPAEVSYQKFSEIPKSAQAAYMEALNNEYTA